MAFVVLLRGVNVGGKTFRPAELARKLTRLKLSSVGAAGTFLARGTASDEEIRRAISAELPFETEIIVVPVKAVEQALRVDPLGGRAPDAGARRFLTVAASRLPKPPRLPLWFPEKTKWEVVITAIRGPIVAGLNRRLGERLLYPNAVVEKQFSVRSTTRWWETFQALLALVEPEGSASPRSDGHRVPPGRES
ncbi:MAG: DUF1697 domain-containing protein [Thermoplasmata archaeon]|nr:DUF1697 domain-containing protein [Thermoplasmata archaeon]